MQATADRSKLLSLRRALNISRLDLVRVADISLGTVRNCEKGFTVNEQSALQILQAVNHWLKARGKEETTLDALDSQTKELTMSVPQPFGSDVGFHLIAAESLPLCFTLEDSFQLNGMSWVLWDVNNQELYEKRDLYRCVIVAAHEYDILDRAIPFGDLLEREALQVFFSAQHFQQLLALQPNLSLAPRKKARAFLTGIEGSEPGIAPSGSIEVAVPFASFRTITERATYGAARHGKHVVMLHSHLLYLKAALFTLERDIEHESDRVRRQTLVHQKEQLQQMRNIRSEWMHQHKQYVRIDSYSKDTYIVRVGLHPSLYEEVA